MSYLGGSGVAGASPVLTKPAGVSVGDLLLVHAQIRGGTGSAATPPAGWNLIDRQDSTTIEGSAFWYRVVDGTEGATFTFSLSNSASSAIIAAYSGIDPVNPIDGFTSISGSVLQVYTMPALTTTKDGTTLVIGGGQKDPTGSFALTPGSWTTRTNTPTSSAYSQLSEAAGPATAGSTGTFTVTGATANTGVFHMLALRPAASGATTLRRAAQGRSGQGRSNFFAGADTTPPGNINVTNVTLTKVSRVAGKDATDVTFTANEAFVEYMIRKVSSGADTRTMGTLIEQATISGGTIARVQKATPITSAVSGNSIAITLPNNVAVGNHIVVFLGFSGALGITVTSVVDQAGNTYSVDVLTDDGNATGAYSAVISARCTTALTAGQTITATLSSAVTHRLISAAEYSGLASASWVDSSSNTGKGTSTAPASEIGRASCRERV